MFAFVAKLCYNFTIKQQNSLLKNGGEVVRKMRFFVPLSNIRGNIVKIDGQEFRHLHKVLRLGTGAEIFVICNDGNIRKCQLTSIHKDHALAEVIDIKNQQVEGASITVFQALVKSEPMSYAVQKCTELGVGTFVPFVSQHTVIQDKGQVQSRLQRIAMASCKQSGRLTNMDVKPTQVFDEMCNQLEQFDHVIVAYEHDTTNAKDVLGKLNVADKIAVVIGGEGGFSSAEAEKLKTLSNVHFVSLGRLILRAETAVVALVSAIKYELGEFTNESSNVDTGV